MQNSNRIYKKNVKLKGIISAVCAVILVCIMIMVGIFFWFQKYIVYTADGLYLDVPWLEETSESQKGEK